MKKRTRSSSSVPRVQAVQPAPSMTSSWPYFAWLVVTAVAGYFAKGPILVVAAIVFLAIGAAWMGRRFPLTTVFIVGFIRGLMGR